MATENRDPQSPSKLPGNATITRDNTLKLWCIRYFAFAWMILIAVDTLPTAYATFFPFKYEINNRLRHLGLSQGDWPLFAPNPEITNGVVIAELIDHKQNTHSWSSIDWSQASIWEKFYRFRHMNYLQRVSHNLVAYEDLVDYVKRALPEQSKHSNDEVWFPVVQFMETAPLEPPIVESKLFQFEQRMVMPEDSTLPKQADTIWSTYSKFLTKREYIP